jgi:glutamine synthetase
MWIGKRLPVSDFLRLLDADGVPFCDVFLAITRSGDNVVEPVGGAQYPTYFPRKEQGYPDILLRPDLGTTRVLSWHDGTIAVNGSYHLPDGAAVPIAPRNILAAQVERAAEHGIEVKIGFEFEFYLLKATLESLQANGYQLEPLSSRPYTYSVLRSSMDNPLLSRLRNALETAGVHVEALNPETGPGQYELNTRYVEAMRAGDDAFMYKNALKELVAQDGLLATFMARPHREWPSSSCHLHQSLWSRETGEPLLAEDDPHLKLSKTGRHYLGGLLSTLVDFSAIYWPTVNSYKRPMPYSWAATTESWGYDNRSVAVRVVGEHKPALRLENRMPGADVNPYLAIAASLAGGLHGIENRIDPPEPVLGDAYADPKLRSLPRTFSEALDALESSTTARTCFGDDFVDHYVAMKRWEVAQYDQEVSGWEVRHYVETA